MKKFKYIYQILLTLSISFIVGCSQDELTKLPVSSISEDVFWTSEEEVIMATNAAYLTLENVDRIEWDGFTELLFSQTGSTKEIATGGINPGSDVVNALWTESYESIRQANWFLNNVDKSPVSSNELAKYNGQWRFVRAWAHYKLLYQFGGVPIVTDVLKVNEGRVETNTRAEVLDFVLSELDLTITELSASDYNPEKGRITTWATKALKARILLYEGTLNNNSGYLQQSANLSIDIIDNGGYSLHSNYTELFRPEGDSSNEIILARINADKEGEYHNLGTRLGPPSFHGSYNTYSPTRALVDKYPDINGKSIDNSSLYDPNEPFKNRDPRLKQTIFDWTKDVVYEGAEFVNTGTWFNFRKFIDPNEKSDRSHNDHIIFRLGEIYLNYIEANNELNGPSQELLDYLNELRTRGGKGAAADGSDIYVAPIALSGLTKESFRNIIRRDRLIELVGEGIVYYDYHRWGLLDETMNEPAQAVKPLENRTFTAPRDYTWPIPDFELINNPNLTQNSGY